MPTPRTKSPNDGHGLEKSISRTSSLSHSPTEEDLINGIPAVNSEEYERRETGYPAHDARYDRGQAKRQPVPLSMHYAGQPPPFDENSPSASTISTKDTHGRGQFFGMKPKHPVHLKSGREMAPAEDGEAKRRKLGKDEDSPANASDFGDIGAMPSWERNMSGWSVCSGMTGMESLIQKDLAGNGVLSAFSFSSEMSKKEKKEGDPVIQHPDGESPPDQSAKVKKKHAHVQFSQSFEGQPHPHASRKRMHDGRGMPPPGRYRRSAHEEYAAYPPTSHPSELPPPLPSHGYEYSPHPRYRYPPREYEEDPYYDYAYGYPRHYDYRGYRPPPPPYPYRPPPPQEYDYNTSSQPTGAPPSGARQPAHVYTAPPAQRPAITGTWVKEDDLALMDIMKKHKTIKNWDPIAKKLNRGKRLVSLLLLTFK